MAAKRDKKQEPGKTDSIEVNEEDLTAKELEGVTGGARRDLLAHEVTQAFPASYNPKEISIDKSVPWQKHK